MSTLETHDQLSPLSSSPPAMTVELQAPENCQMKLKRKRGNEGDDAPTILLEQLLRCTFAIRSITPVTPPSAEHQPRLSPFEASATLAETETLETRLTTFVEPFVFCLDLPPCKHYIVPHLSAKTINSPRSTRLRRLRRLAAEDLTGGKRTCAGCCVEVGSEGRVWCLPCYNDETELELYNTKKTKEELGVE
ncbi:MAG: hypothetical protein LQ340_007945, partial [Diploschistes diacapsis]